MRDMCVVCVGCVLYVGGCIQSDIRMKNLRSHMCYAAYVLTTVLTHAVFLPVVLLHSRVWVDRAIKLAPPPKVTTTPY